MTGIILLSIARRRLLFVVGFASALCVQSFASAQPTQSREPRLQEARRLFESGSRAFEEGRFEIALGYFEQAQQIAARPELLYNIGRAAEEAHQTARAIEAYRAYLDETEGQDSGTANTRHNEVRARLAVLETTHAETVETENARAAPTTDAPVVTLDSTTQPAHSVVDEGWFWPVLLGGAAVVAGGVVLALVLAFESNRVPVGDDGVHTEALSVAPQMRF